MTRGRVLLAGGLVACVSLLLAASGTALGIKEGGTFRVGISLGQFSPAIDPVLPYSLSTGLVFSATCAGLLASRDEPLPNGYRLVPEIATDFPKITNGGKTYTFTVRRDFRFSTGKRVTARDVARSINRALSPVMQSPTAGTYRFIVGGQAVLDGKAKAAGGVVAKGDTLTIRLTKRVGDFLPTVGLECILPEATPVDPEGLKAPIPGAGPYYISQHVLNRRVVLERSRFYRGRRPHHVDRFVVDLELDSSTILDRVDQGELDYASVPSSTYGPQAEQLRAKYGVKGPRFFVAPGTFLRMFALNTSRPLFRKNPKLRQAVNFAVDRRALLRERGPLAGYATDQYLPATFPAFREERIYPLKGPDLRTARALAKGHLRSGKAVVYVLATPAAVAQGQILKANLSEIGIDVDVQAFPGGSLFAKMATAGEPFDIGWIGWEAGFPVPNPRLLEIFDGRTIRTPDNINYSYFDAPKYNRLFEEASRLNGNARDRAYGELDVNLAKNAAPAIAYAYDNVLTLVSRRTGCVIVKPYLDLAAVCLK